MKTRTFVSILILVLIVLIIAGSCATMKSPDKMVYERFCGTWVNTEYEGKEWPRVKLIFTPDGTITFYSVLHDTSTYHGLSYTVEKRWTDSEDNSWYHIIVKGPKDPRATEYLLLKLEKYNTILEYNYSGTKYPDAIDPKDWHSDYRIYYRY